jgi:hypothetical protein
MQLLHQGLRSRVGCQKRLTERKLNREKALRTASRTKTALKPRIQNVGSVQHAMPTSETDGAMSLNLLNYPSFIWKY